MEAEFHAEPRNDRYALAAGLLSIMCFAVLVFPAWPASRTYEAIAAVLFQLPDKLFPPHNAIVFSRCSAGTSSMTII